MGFSYFYLTIDITNIGKNYYLFMYITHMGDNGKGTSSAGSYGNLIVRGANPFDERRTESPVLHLIQPGNRTTFRCGYFINLFFRMTVSLEQQFGRPFYGLGSNQVSRFRIKTYFNSSLRRGPNKPQCKGNPAGSQYGGRIHQFFINGHSDPQDIK